MADREPGASRGRTGSNMQWKRQFMVTIFLLIGFAALVTAMMFMADGGDVVWQRRVYVFSTVQALVFTAVGWLFGREVNRSAVESAQGDAAVAKEDAVRARSEVQQETERTAEAVARAAEAEAKAHALHAAVRSSVLAAGGGVQDVSGVGARPAGVVDLRAFADELFQPASGIPPRHQ